MILSLTAYDRPHYLLPVIESLVVAIEELDETVGLVANVEPSPVQEEVVGLIKSISLPTTVHVTLNPHRIGLQRNTITALDRAWTLAILRDEDFVLHLEDDLLVAPDGLRLAAWMRDIYREEDRVPFVSLTNAYANEYGERYGVPPREDWFSVWRSQYFECHVWGAWRSGWEELRAVWPHQWPNEWAARVNGYERAVDWRPGLMGDRFQIRPCLSRSYSIGEFGEHHSGPDDQREHNPEIWSGDLGSEAFAASYTGTYSEKHDA